MTVVSLGEVADINPRGDRPHADETISFVGMADLSAGTATAGPGVDRPFAEVSKGYTIFRRDDLLVAKITPCFENGKIGQAKLSRRIGVGSTEFHVVSPKAEHLDRRYALHFLRQERIRLEGERRMTGSAGQRRVPKSYLESLQVPLPPIADQRRLASILDYADGLRRGRRRALGDLERLTGEVFRDMFGSLEVEKSAAGDRFRDHVVSLQGGRNLVGADPTAITRFRVLKISAVTTGTYLAHESKPLPSDYVPNPDHLVRVGDLLMSRANTTEMVGATALVRSTPPNIAVPDKLWRLIWRDPEGVAPRYMAALLQQPAVRRGLSALSSGTGGSMKNISKAKLMEMPFPVASQVEQRTFADRAVRIDVLAAKAREQLERLDELLASLQARAFSGRL